ncbi:hypothetical protein CDO43_39130, partial [Pseudomonas aeruginosa]
VCACLTVYPPLRVPPRPAGAMVAALLHNLSTLLVLGNAGRLLSFEEPLGQPRPAVEGREEEGTP